MNEKRVKKMSATALRATLGVSLFILAIGGGIAFFYGYGVVSNYATGVSQAKADETASANTLSILSTLENQLDANTITVERLNQFYITTELPQFRAINDVRNYANRHNLPVGTISFVEAAESAPANPQTGAAQPAPPAASPGPGGNYISVILTLSDPVQYQQLLNFLFDIERSLPASENS